MFNPAFLEILLRLRLQGSFYDTGEAYKAMLFTEVLEKEGDLFFFAQFYPLTTGELGMSPEGWASKRNIMRRRRMTFQTLTLTLEN